MVPIMSSTEIQTTPVALAVAKPNTQASESGGAVLSLSATAASRESRRETVDTITLQSQSAQQVKSTVDPAQNSRTENQERAMSAILFSYNFKGDLRIKFMDSVNKLVYQTPPVYLSRISDLMMSPKTSVSTKV